MLIKISVKVKVEMFLTKNENIRKYEYNIFRRHLKTSWEPGNCICNRQMNMLIMKFKYLEIMVAFT